MRSRLLSVVGWWSEATRIDYALAAFVIVAHVIAVKESGSGDWLGWLQSAQRITLYGTGAMVVAIIGGLGAIAVSVYLAAGGERARAVRTHYPSALRRNWLALILGTGFAAGLCLIAQALDTGQDPFFGRFVFEFGMAVAALRFVRLAWLFNAMVKVADRDLTDASPGSPLRLGDSWSSKAS